jgi:uncharacterized membrane protein
MSNETRAAVAAGSARRVQLLDALRGFCIILVVAYHLGINLAVRGHLPAGVIDNLLLNSLQVFFAGIFIVLAGVSSRFSRNNFKRGLQLTGCALLVTAASFAVLPDPLLSLRYALGFYQPAKGELLGVPILIGILHLLAACVLLYALLEKLKIPSALVVTLAAFFSLFFGVTKWPDVLSADKFPILPWGFLFFLGVWLGKPIQMKKFPEWFYSAEIPVFPAIGRKTLLIYLLHQPVLYGILWIVESFG